MYEIEKNEEVFDFSMLNLKTHEKVYFRNVEELLLFLTRKQGTSSWFREEGFCNPYLDGFNETGYERRVVTVYNPTIRDFEYVSELKPYMFFDKNGEVYDVRVHHKNLIKRRKDYDWERKLAMMPDFEFRRGPVPGTSVKYRGHFLRHMKTTNERRANSIPEYKQYVRGKRKPHNLPNVYDDIPVLRQRSWKTHTKERHQWAKHFNGARVPDKYKTNDFFDYDEED